MYRRRRAHYDDSSYPPNEEYYDNYHNSRDDEYYGDPNARDDYYKNNDPNEYYDGDDYNYNNNSNSNNNYDYWPQRDLHYGAVRRNYSRSHNRDLYAPAPYAGANTFSGGHHYGSSAAEHGNSGGSNVHRLAAYPSHRRTTAAAFDSASSNSAASRPYSPPPPASSSSFASLLDRADSLFAPPRAAAAPQTAPAAAADAWGHLRGGTRGAAVDSSPLLPHSVILPLDVKCEVTSVEATINWATTSFISRAPFVFIYSLQVENGESCDVYNVASWKTRFTIPLKSGTYYRVKVEAVTPDKTVVACGMAEFKAVFDGFELHQVYHLAFSFLKQLSETSFPQPCQQRFYIFYRNKPTAYFDKVRMQDGGIMKTYRKDDNGHPASPINGEIDGLFFNARLPGGYMPKTSPFGNIRISIPAEYLFTPKHRLYFCDFYCNNSTHYVTVVACLQNSSTDLYCKRWLLPLNPTNNIFLYVRTNPSTGALEHYVNSAIWVEFYYTENIPVHWGSFDTVASTGQSKPNGVPNNKNCTICNLYPIIIPSPAAETETSNSRSSKRRLSADDHYDRRESSENQHNNNKKPRRRNSSLKAEARDFLLPKYTESSTFDTALRVQKGIQTSRGERLECADPMVVIAVCSLVDDVVKRQEEEFEGETKITTDFFNQKQQETISDCAQKQEIIRSGEEEDHSNNEKIDNELLLLVDKTYDGQVKALKEFREREGKLTQIMQNVEELVGEAKILGEKLSKKISKLDKL